MCLSRTGSLVRCPLQDSGLNIVEASTSFTKIATAFLIAASLIGTVAVKGVGYAADIKSIQEIQDKQTDNIAAIEELKGGQAEMNEKLEQNASDMQVLMQGVGKILDNPIFQSD